MDRRDRQREILRKKRDCERGMEIDRKWERQRQRQTVKKNLLHQPIAFYL